MDYANRYCYALPNIIFLGYVKSGTNSWESYNNKVIQVYSSDFLGACNDNIILFGGVTYTDLSQSFVVGARKASLETL